MDDTKSFASHSKRLTLALGVAFALAAGHWLHAEVTYVSSKQVATLAADFDGAGISNAAVLANTSWTCDMYGVRSQLQVRRDQKLYAFTSKPGEVHAFVNSGDEPVHEYVLNDQTLEGHGEKDVLDQVRVMTDGRLISKLSVPSRKITVAYAVCKGS